MRYYQTCIQLPNALTAHLSTGLIYALLAGDLGNVAFRSKAIGILQPAEQTGEHIVPHISAAPHGCLAPSSRRDSAQ